jgi:ABC-type microcin C transport system permease subunit YejB
MPFYFFCLLLGIIVGALFTWFVLAEHPFESREAPGGPVDQLEAGVLAGQMKAGGAELDEETIAEVLRLHGAYVVGREDVSGAQAVDNAKIENHPADDKAEQPSA